MTLFPNLNPGGDISSPSGSILGSASPTGFALAVAPLLGYVLDITPPFQ